MIFIRLAKHIPRKVYPREYLLGKVGVTESHG